MIQRFTITAIATLALLGLAACGEKPQEITGTASKVDDVPYSGVGKSQYAQPGWSSGDRTSWEQQLKTRAQYGQNDYVRIGAQQ